MLHWDNKKTQKKSHTHTVKAVAAWLEWRKDGVYGRAENTKQQTGGCEN